MRLTSKLFTIFNLLLLFIITSSSLFAQIYSWRKSAGGIGWTVSLNPLNSNSIYCESFTGKFYVSYNKGITWQYRSNPGPTYIRQILVHPNDTMTIFCVAEEDVYGLRKSTDYGLTWHTVLSNYKIDGESVTYDPVHPDTMFAGDFTTGNIYRSYDRGEHWNLAGTVGTFLCGIAVRPDSANILYAGIGNAIKKSTNYGNTWKTTWTKNSSAFNEIPKIEISPINPLIAYASIFGDISDTTLHILKTTNGGETWFTTASSGITNWGLCIDRVDPGTAYGGTFWNGLINDTISAITKTTDGGNHWTNLKNGLPMNLAAWSLKIDPVDPTTLWLAGDFGNNQINGIYKWASTSTGIQGMILDSLSADTVRNGTITDYTIQNTTKLKESGGSFAFGYFPSDPFFSQSLRITAYPYYIKDITIPLALDSIQIQNILLHKLPTSTISGTLRDVTTHLPVKAALKLFVSTSLGKQVIVDSTDNSGAYTFADLFISYGQLNQYDSILIEPQFPYAKQSIRSISLTGSNINFITDLEIADVLIVSANGSGDYFSYYRTALLGANATAVEWNISQAGIPPMSTAIQFKKKTLIYYTGIRHTALPQAELDSITACIQAGCNVFITGQDIVEKNDTTNLIKNIIGVQYGGTGIGMAKGTDKELLSGMLFFIASVEGANNQTSRDIITITNPQVKPILSYGQFGQAGVAAVRMYNPVTKGKLVLMGAGFEAVATVQTRATVMSQILQYFNSQDIDIAVNVETRWNMISLPLQVIDNSKESLFPTAASQAFNYTDGYHAQSQMYAGIGYWLRFGSAQAVILGGLPAAIETVAVQSGWNLIGSISTPVSNASIGQIPPNIIQSPFYGYESGYFLSSAIMPGKAYWVKTSSSGQLVLSSSSIAPKLQYDPLSEMNRLTIQDATGRSQTLYFGSMSSDKLSYYELPPLPPEGIFDARFASNNMIATPESGKDVQILLSSAVYPVTISWESKSKSLAILKIDGRELSMKTNGSTHIPKPTSQIGLSFSNDPSFPKEFALEQNYPNPFNPTTSIQYAVVSTQYVSLKVYDLLGQVVATLVDEVQDVGYKSVEWNAEKMASGIYFYKLQTGTFTETKKMMVLR